MKKTIVSALTTALVVGAASTTFAAANPFTDVPSDHWAYDAVAQLAADGIINGYGTDTYGNGSFKGDQNMTRYEMAQVIAKAMAKRGMASNVDKATIDKLAAEFGDELANLGVRVANLEKKVDNVIWNGEAYYEYKSSWKDDESGHDREGNLTIRLEPSMKVNEQWTVHTRLESSLDADAGTDSIAGEGSELQFKHLWAEGDIADNVTVRLGRLYYVTNADEGMILDNPVSGAQIEAGKVLKVVATAGRYSNDDVNDAATYIGAEVFGETGKWTLGAGYHTLKKDSVFNAQMTEENEPNENYIGRGSKDIYLASARYKFSDKWSMGGVYAKGNVDSDKNAVKDGDKAYSIQLDYGSSDQEVKGSYNIFAAYRYLGKFAVIDPTYDGITSDYKGFHFGANYTFLKNVVGTLEYFTGKTISDDKNANIFFGKLDFFF